MTAKLINRNDGRELAYERELTRLRELVLGDDYQAAVEKIVAQGFSERVAAVLVEAIIERNRRDRTMGSALAPVIGPALRKSIRDDPHSIIDIIFPIIGPSIRKAVANAVMDALLSLNDLVERSVGLRSLRWRYEAWRKGQKYSLYVLSRNLLWRVDQAFLIDKASGILMASVSNMHYRDQDPDLVSSMLTAINDFVIDSFETGEQDALERIRYGERIIQVNVGNQVTLALAVTGMVSQDIKAHTLDVLEKIELEYRDLLDAFAGDKATMAPVEPLLETCLIEKRQEKDEDNTPWIAIAMLVIPLLWLGSLFVQQYNDNRLFNALAAELDARPGVTVVEKSWDRGVAVANLIQDPLLAEALAEDAVSAQVPFPVRLDIHYASADKHEVVLSYLQNRYALPQPPQISADGNTLILRGAIHPATLDALKQDSVLLRYFAHFDERAVLPFQESALRENLAEQLLRLVSAINDTRIFFEVAESRLRPEEEAKLQTLGRQVRELLQKSSGIPNFVQQVLVLGFADDTGTAASNLAISQARAERVADFLVAQGIARKRLVVKAMGHTDSAVLADNQKRRVSLSLIHGALRDVESGGGAL